MTNKKLLFVSSYEAANNYIHSLILKKLKFKYIIVTSSIGSDYFKKKKIKCYDVRNFQELKSKIKKYSPDYIFTVLQFPDSIENKSIEIANNLGIRTVTAVDNWFPVLDRFRVKSRKNDVKSINYLSTDYILVNDKKVKSDLENIYKKSAIKCFGNPFLEQRWGDNYMKSLKKKCTKKNNEFSNSFLFISEPYSDLSSSNKDLINPGFCEFQIVDDIMKNIEKDKRLLIKLHPAESKIKYKKLIKKYKNLSLAKDKDLDVIIYSCIKVIGMGSMLLIEAGMIRNDVISYRPNEKFEFVGNKYKITKLVKTLRSLKTELSKRVKNVRHKQIHNNSSTKIINFLNSKLL